MRGTTARARLTEAMARNAAHIVELERDHSRIIAATQDSNADDEHDPEGATIAFEREQLTALLAQARRTYEDGERALIHLELGTYGRCERCGDVIAADRLEARPAVRTCITCARRGPVSQMPAHGGQQRLESDGQSR
jgi:DnaK suppressor protein